MPPGIGYPPSSPLGTEDDLLAELGLSKAPMLPPMPPAAAGGDMSGGAQPQPDPSGGLPQSLGMFDSQGPHGGGLAAPGAPDVLGAPAGPAMPMSTPGFAPGGTPEDMAKQFIEKMMGRGKAPGA